jgi:hypothetical protein
MIEVLKIGAAIATPLGFLGFVAALVYYIRARQLKHKESLVEQLSQEDRAHFLDESLTRYNIDASNATREEKFQLIRDEMDKRYRLAILYTVVSAIVFIVCFALAVYTFASTQPGNPTQRPSSLGWYNRMPPGQYALKPEFRGIPSTIDNDQEIPAYLEYEDYKKVQKLQTPNQGKKVYPPYYLFATRVLQENEMLPKRFAFRTTIQAEVVLYVQEFIDRWTSFRTQQRITLPKQTIDLPDRSSARRKHMVVLVVFPFDIPSFRKKLAENEWNIDGLLDVEF